MSTTTTVRVLIGSVIAACVVGIGALEMVSERVHVDVGSAVQGAPDARPDSTQSIADLEFREEPGPSPAHMTGALQRGRHTVVTVDPAARRFLSLTSTGQVRVSEVSKGTLVVTEEAQGGVALLEPGDIIKVEAPYGPILRIVVLRRGWQELGSSEQ